MTSSVTVGLCNLCVTRLNSEGHFSREDSNDVRHVRVPIEVKNQVTGTKQ